MQSYRCCWRLASTLAFSFKPRSLKQRVITGTPVTGPRSVARKIMRLTACLTEHQRQQQMRDLMQQARHEQPPVIKEGNGDNASFVTAVLDESAVRVR